MIQKRDHVQKPDRVLLVAVFKIKIRIVTGPAHFRGFGFRVVCAGHRLRKTNQLCLFAADRPIVPVAAQGNDPLLSVAIFKQHMQPPLKPRTRPEWAGRIDIGSLIKEQRDKAIHVVRQFLEVDVIKVLARLHAEPKFFVIVVQRVGKSVDEHSDLFFVNGIDLLPIDHHAGRLGVA